MAATESKKRPIAVKIAWVIVCMVGMALLLPVVSAILGFASGKGSVIRQAINGASFGAIVGGTSAKIITRWTQGAVVGAMLGATGSTIWWIAINTGMIATPDKGIPSFVSVVLPLTLVYAFSGAIAAGFYAHTVFNFNDDQNERD